MYLRTLKLWNFRKYGNVNHLHNIEKNTKPDLIIEFNERLNVLIGENDSGKTAIIDAIKHVLNTKSLEYIQLENKDFFEYYNEKNQQRERASELRIECKFNISEDKEAGSFLEWIGFDDKKKYELTVWLTSTNKNQKIITTIRAGQDDDGTHMDGEARENLKVTYLKPLRDALSELTPGYKSRLANILRGHEVFKTENSPDGNKKIHKLEEKAKKANEPIRDYFDIQKHLDDKENENHKGGKITKEIEELLKDLSFGGSVNEPSIELTDEELVEILKSLKLVNDSNKSGLGSLNKLYMAAEFLLLKQSKGRDLKLALIEEMEAHLHPQAQLKIIDTLQKDQFFNGQLILTSHSTTLASKVNLSNLIVCHKTEVFPMFKGTTKLNIGDYEFLDRFLDDTKSNLFFAKGVIMVEGDAENLLIPTIAEIIDRPLHDYGVTLVNVGNAYFFRYTRIFQRIDGKQMNIPIACLSDLDIEMEKDGENLVCKKGNSVDILKEIAENNKKSIEDKNDTIKVFTSPLWTLEFDLLNSDGIIRELLYTSILEARLIKSRSNKYQGLNEKDEKSRQQIAKTNIDLYCKKYSNNNLLIAFKIFSKYFKGSNPVSKTITAQRFAMHLRENREKVKKCILSGEEFQYIKDAIYHVTKKLE